MAIADLTEQTLQQLVSLAGRVAVITGGKSGIGHAVCKRFAEAGANIVLASTHEDKAKQVAEGLKSPQSKVIGMAVDVRNSQMVEALADRAVQEFGRLDIWVNDAGIFPVKPALDVTDEEWTQTIDTDLTGTFYGARAAARRMQQLGNGGVIINIASSLGFRGVPNQAAYVAAKWGVRGLTAALSTELGKDNIRVLAIAPGLTRSPGMLKVMESVDQQTGGSIGDQFAATLPLQRLAEPDDIARVVLFAASDLAMFMTGSTLLGDGGEVYGAGATAATS
jgi:NAD(P)-dependent dehydrogenase (short-subunit alcohol dehydrogenase family)